MSFWTQNERNIFVAAHRGWSAKYPENTMEAFRAAAALDVDQIETDIRVSKDGDLVIFHDKTVDRVTNGTGNVCDLTLRELRALDAGVKKDEAFAGCRIPLFAEFVEFVRALPRMTIDFELKEYPTPGYEKTAYDVCDRALRIIDEAGLAERCVINTFSARLHEYIFTKYDGKYKQHAYFPITEYMDSYTIDPYSYPYCVCMFGSPYIASKEDCARMRERGVRVWAGAGVKDEAGVDAAIASGAELITCNNPDEILAILRAKGYHS